MQRRPLRDNTPVAFRITPYLRFSYDSHYLDGRGVSDGLSIGNLSQNKIEGGDMLNHFINL
jgi:hypothetical protein